MQVEKALRINLPDGIEFRGVEVTDGGLLITYAIENDIDFINISITDSIARPTRLVGGTRVYQKEGTNYWFCKIKNGRDEFMYLDFSDLTEDDILYTKDGEERKFVTERQKEFRENAIKAIENKPAEGFRWIPVYEASGNYYSGILRFVSGANVLTDISTNSWKEFFEKYSPENGSRMASITTYFLLLLRLLKDGYVTIEQLADDSKEIGRYYDSKNNDTLQEFEMTGTRQLGGLSCLGNSQKIVLDPESKTGFSIVGGSFDDLGIDRPFACVDKNLPGWFIPYYSVGLLELTR